MSNRYPSRSRGDECKWDSCSALLRGLTVAGSRHPRAREHVCGRGGRSDCPTVSQGLAVVRGSGYVALSIEECRLARACAVAHLNIQSRRPAVIVVGESRDYGSPIEQICATFSRLNIASIENIQRVGRMRCVPDHQVVRRGIWTRRDHQRPLPRPLHGAQGQDTSQEGRSIKLVSSRVGLIKDCATVKVAGGVGEYGHSWVVREAFDIKQRAAPRAVPIYSLLTVCEEMRKERV